MTDPGCSTAEAMVAAAVAGGGAALGDPISGLQPGASADIVALRPDHPALAGHTPASFLDAWVFNAGTALIDTVWIRGTIRVSGGHHPERARVAAKFAAVMARLLSD
jgi:cytosine/adenosine deaminase-related metal-dependent hydrolase